MNKFDIAVGNEPEKLVRTEARTNLDIAQEIATKISDYLGFDVNSLIDNTDSVIFGGATRDALAGLDIHDVDIMALPQACQVLSNRLIDRGFRRIYCYTPDIASLYIGMSLINEPLTFINNDDKLVQLIRPRVRFDTSDNYLIIDPLTQLRTCLSSVDMSSSGVTYSTNVIVSRFWSGMQGECTDWSRVAEVCADAIEHCRHRQFKVLPDNAFHQKNRINHRIAKLTDRGWKKIVDVSRYI